jgi:hypothetical protein
MRRLPAPLGFRPDPCWTGMSHEATSPIDQARPFGNTPPNNRSRQKPPLALLNWPVGGRPGSSRLGYHLGEESIHRRRKVT